MRWESNTRWGLLAAALVVLAVPALAQRPRPVDPVGAVLRMSPPVQVGFAATLGPGLLIGPFDPPPEIGLPVIAAGLVLGPAAGYAYADDLGGAVPGLMWRSGGAVASYVYLDWLGDKVREAGLGGGILVAMVGALPLAAGWTVLVAVDLARLERRWKAGRTQQRFAVVPWASSEGGGLRLQVAL